MPLGCQALLPATRLTQTAAADAQTSEKPRMKKFLVYRWVSNLALVVLSMTSLSSPTLGLGYNVASFPGRPLLCFLDCIHDL